MNKHFLVSISNDVDNLFGVQFICNFFKKTSEHRLTLLHICRLDSADMNSALMEMWNNPDDKVSGCLTVGVRRSIDRAMRLLGESRMSVDHIETKTVSERYGKVKDILAEGTQGLYDAIVLGRRASYAMQWLFERPAQETAQAMIGDASFSCPLWICPEQSAGRKNVLLCLDGSENSYRAADHVGYILTRQEQHAVTLFTVSPGPGGDEKVFSRAIDILHGHNIADERIEQRSAWGLSVIASILSETSRGAYAAVAVGLHGEGRGLMKNLNLAGGTTAKLIGRIEQAALWCCP